MPQCLLIASLLALGAQAAPVQPRSDDDIIEVLPTLGGYAAEQKRLRRALAQQPRDAATALALSRSTLERARHDGDARLAGQALGVLSAWDGDANAPVEIRLQRATLRQYLHEFDASVAELRDLLRVAPRHPQALLTLATVLRVQGKYDESDATCLRLIDAGQALYARACSAETRRCAAASMRPAASSMRCCRPSPAMPSGPPGSAPPTANSKPAPAGRPKPCRNCKPHSRLRPTTAMRASR